MMEKIIYVGRSTEKTLGRRLYEHTAVRLSTRRDRFSWFGLLLVTADGKLKDLPTKYNGAFIVPALEAILIEALEPRQYRKRGDDLSAVEYLQKEIPDIERQSREEIIQAALSRSLQQN